MKNHELLDMIGEAGEDYVLDADNNAARPRSNWKALAACAACAALVLAAYPVYRAFNPPLHDYAVVERGGILETQQKAIAPAGGADVPAPALPGGAYIGEDDSSQENGIDGIGYDIPGQDVPVQEAAMAQYDGLLQGLGGQDGYEPEIGPDWFGGAWIDNDYYPEAKLAVAIVDGFRTAELEAQIQEWCGGEVVFRDVKYSQKDLYTLQDQAVKTVTSPGYELQFAVGVYVMDNCLGVDIYGDAIPDAVLAELARLDPDGDAIRVRVFSGSLSVSDDLVKGPALEEPAVEPDEPEARATPATPIDGSELALNEPAVEDFKPDYDPTFEDGLPADYDVIPEGG